MLRLLIVCWTWITLTEAQGHCLPHQSCADGDCCAQGSSCNTCSYGYHTSNDVCSGRGNRRCNYPPEPTPSPTELRIGDPTESPTSSPDFWEENAGWCLPHQTCNNGDCCALGTSCNTCALGFHESNDVCAARGNRRCNEPPEVEDGLPTESPTSSPETASQSAGHCLPHETCGNGDCCAEGSSCNTCPLGYHVSDDVCAWRGNRRCNVPTSPEQIEQPPEEEEESTNRPESTEDVNSKSEIPTLMPTVSNEAIDYCSLITLEDNCAKGFCAFYDGKCHSRCTQFENSSWLTSNSSSVFTYDDLETVEECELLCLRQSQCQNYLWDNAALMCSLLPSDYEDLVNATQAIVGRCSGNVPSTQPGVEAAPAQNEEGKDFQLFTFLAIGVGGFVCLGLTLFLCMHCYSTGNKTTTKDAPLEYNDGSVWKPDHLSVLDQYNSTAGGLELREEYISNTVDSEYYMQKTDSTNL